MVSQGSQSGMAPHAAHGAVGCHPGLAALTDNLVGSRQTRPLWIRTHRTLRAEHLKSASKRLWSRYASSARAQWNLKGIYNQGDCAEIAYRDYGVPRTGVLSSSVKHRLF